MKGNGLHNLAKNMRTRSVQAREGMERKILTAVGTTARDAIAHTPVDTGRARASFEVGVQQQPDGRHEPYVPYPALHSKVATYKAGRHFETANLMGAYGAVGVALDRYRLGSKVYIVNAVEDDKSGGHYLQFLNTIPGYSLQPAALAGLFFLEDAADAGREAARAERVFR